MNKITIGLALPSLLLISGCSVPEEKQTCYNRIEVDCYSIMPENATGDYSSQDFGGGRYNCCFDVAYLEDGIYKTREDCMATNITRTVNICY